MGMRRWIVIALLFAAMVISYIDRQTYGILKSSITHDLGWSNTDFANVHMCFQAAYAIFYLIWGRIVDRIGARIGFAVAFGLWSVAQVFTAGAQRIGDFMFARAALGVGESGAFPSAIKSVAEWFPQKERALANGFFNGGTNIGAIVAPIAVPLITLSYGWHAAFLFTGAIGLIWLPIWLLLYRRPREHKAISAAELAWIEQDPPQPPVAKLPLGWVLKQRQTWAYAIGKFLTDPIFGMYLIWLPDFLGKRYGLDLRALIWPLASIYLLTDVGSLFGGWLSSHFLKRGWSVNAARKGALVVCALGALPVFTAQLADNVWITVLIIGLAGAAHQGFSATLYALPADLMPRAAVGSVAGVGGMLGAAGGIVMSKYAGTVLDQGHSYLPIFLVASCAYLAAVLAIHILSPRMALATA